MRQVRITKVSRTRTQRRQALLDVLPLDPRDPDISRAKQRQRERSPAMNVRQGGEHAGSHGRRSRHRCRSCTRPCPGGGAGSLGPPGRFAPRAHRGCRYRMHRDRASGISGRHGEDTWHEIRHVLGPAGLDRERTPGARTARSTSQPVGNCGRTRSSMCPSTAGAAGTSGHHGRDERRPGTGRRSPGGRDLVHGRSGHR